MAERFEIGEVAIFHNPSSDFHGQEVEIVMERHFAYWKNVDSGEEGGDYGYEIKWADGDITFQLETDLRKRRPPQDWVKLCRLTERMDEVPA